jgi:hypothetical protein
VTGENAQGRLTAVSSERRPVDLLGRLEHCFDI